MAKSKFADIFQNANSTAPVPATEAAPRKARPAKPKPAARAPRRLGRPPGKRSDPAWKQYSVLLKKETQREAVNLLRADEDGPDLSGLVQHLLEGWVKKRRG